MSSKGGGRGQVFPRPSPMARHQTRGEPRFFGTKPALYAIRSSSINPSSSSQVRVLLGLIGCLILSSVMSMKTNLFICALRQLWLLMYAPASVESLLVEAEFSCVTAWITGFQCWTMHSLGLWALQLPLFALRHPPETWDALASLLSGVRTACWRPFACKEEGSSSVAATESNPLVDLPKDLTFAILDDCALIRVLLLTICGSQPIQASPNSFARGDTADECFEFIARVLINQVDVIILDENLDYEHLRLKGSMIAKLLREAGFQGCIVQHSTEAGTFRPEGEGQNAFDGFIPKATSRRTFIAMLAQAYGDSSSRKKQPNELAVPSTNLNE